jgi:hypothetical protein
MGITEDSGLKRARFHIVNASIALSVVAQLNGLKNKITSVFDKTYKLNRANFSLGEAIKSYSKL